MLGAALLSALVLPLAAVPSASASGLSGPAVSWGVNAYGEVGNGTTTNVLSKVGVSGLGSGVATLVAGARHSLAILSNGSVKAWGKNTVGELGNGGTANSSVPVAVTGLGAGSGVIAVSGNAPPLSATSITGNGHSMALKSDGTVLGWGNNNSGQVGNGGITDQLTPVAVVGLGAGSGVVAIAAGGSHSLALKSDGTVLAWGSNTSGQLGDGTMPTAHITPVQVSGLGAGSGVLSIAAGAAFSMALKSNGAVVAWGNNASGQLGNGSVVDRPTPGAVTGLGAGSGTTSIAAGAAFSLALKSSQAVLAWGNNASGQLGNGTAPTDSLTPKAVSGLTAGKGVVQIAAGFAHAFARTSTGGLKAWGRNASGELGDGTLTQHNTPETLAGYVGIASVSAGGAHSLALTGGVLTVSPTSGKPGKAVTISGSRYLAGEAVSVVWWTGLASPAVLPICSVTASGTGTFSCAANIPTTNAGAGGVHLVTGIGGTSFPGSASFKLVPKLAVAPNTGVAGSGVILTGTAYGAGETVDVVYATNLVSPATVPLCSGVTDSTGSFFCGGLIPTTNQGPVGAHRLTGKGRTSRLSAYTSFTLQ